MTPYNHRTLVQGECLWSLQGRHCITCEVPVSVYPTPHTPELLLSSSLQDIGGQVLQPQVTFAEQGAQAALAFMRSSHVYHQVYSKEVGSRVAGLPVPRQGNTILMPNIHLGTQTLVILGIVQVVILGSLVTGTLPRQHTILLPNIHLGTRKAAAAQTCLREFWCINILGTPLSGHSVLRGLRIKPQLKDHHTPSVCQCMCEVTAVQLCLHM